MIAKLTGIVDAPGDGSVVVDVGGVGYLVFCSGRTLARLRPGETVSLAVETHVREDAILLYGFVDRREREWFRLLTTVQGVGAKAALAVLGVLAPDGLAHAIAVGDRGAITRAPGVGPKLAARIVSELRDQAGKADVVLPSPGAAVAGLGGDTRDAVAALVNLGFRQAEAAAAVSHAASRIGIGADVEALIRGGLAELAPREHGR